MRAGGPFDPSAPGVAPTVQHGGFGTYIRCGWEVWETVLRDDVPDAE